MSTTYISPTYATGEAVDAALDKAESAVQFSDLAIATGQVGAADGLIAQMDQALLESVMRHGFEGTDGSTISATGAVFTLGVPTSQIIWVGGTRYELTADLELDFGESPELGQHYVVLQPDSEDNLELSSSQAGWSIPYTAATPCVILYWNGSAFAVQNERHSHNRNLGLHEYLHKTVGARIQNDGSFSQTRPTTTNDGHLELVAGSLWDEDIENEISTAQAKLVRNWYETAAGVWTWANGADNSGYDRPYLWNSGTSLLRYPSTASAYALTDCAANRFIAVWIYASNDVDRPIYVVTPALAATYTTLANARTATAPVLPFAPELKLLYRWIYRGDGEYQEAADYRTASSLPSGGVSAPVAASVVVTPAGNIAATNVQAALEELDDEKTAVTDFALLQQQVNELASVEAPQGSGTYLVSGATIAWVSGYTYRVGAATYRIGGAEISSAEQEVTLAAAHESLPRIDVLVLDTSGVLSAIAGTAGESPAQPTVEPDTYYAVTFIAVAANSSDAEVVTTNIYTEGAEWTATASAASITVDSTNSPRTGTKCLEGTSVAGNTYVTAVAGAAIDPNQQNNLVFYIRHKANWPSQKAIRLTWFNGTAQRGNAFVVGNGAYGLNTQVTGAYQQVVVPMSAFAIPAGLTVDRLRWEITGGGASVGFYLDDWLLQAGVSGQQAPVVLFAGTWVATRVYSVNQIVTRNGGSYIALAPSLNEDPATATASWASLSFAPFYPSFFLQAAPTENQVLLTVVAPGGATMVLPAGQTNARGVASVAATAETVLDIKKNGVSAGSITFAAEGTTATFTVATAISLSAGDRLDVVAPASPDATLAGLAVTLAGYRS